MKKRYYIDKLGLTERPDTYDSKNHKRSKIWKKERKKYGFDERETWGLDYTWYLWLYERLMWFKDNTPVDLSYHKFTYKGQEYTQEEMIDMILERIEFYCKEDFTETKGSDYIKEIGYIWAEICSSMWW